MIPLEGHRHWSLAIGIWSLPGLIVKAFAINPGWHPLRQCATGRSMKRLLRTFSTFTAHLLSKPSPPVAGRQPQSWPSPETVPNEHFPYDLGILPRTRERATGRLEGSADRSITSCDPPAESFGPTPPPPYCYSFVSDPDPAGAASWKVSTAAPTADLTVLPPHGPRALR